LWLRQFVYGINATIVIGMAGRKSRQPFLFGTGLQADDTIICTSARSHGLR
jgi:hypothetical protein